LLIEQPHPWQLLSKSHSVWQFAPGTLLIKQFPDLVAFAGQQIGAKLRRQIVQGFVANLAEVSIALLSPDIQMNEINEKSWSMSRLQRIESDPIDRETDQPAFRASRIPHTANDPGIMSPSHDANIGTVMVSISIDHPLNSRVRCASATTAKMAAETPQ
jgi:hypothetical protein